MSPMPQIRLPGPRPFPPRVSAFNRPFWSGLARGELLTTRCRACGALGFPPRNLCRGCWGRELDWVPLRPRGRLYSFTRVHVAPEAFRAEVPYAIGLIDLDDGVRLMCRLLGEIGPADLDQPMGMVVLAHDDGLLFGARRLQGPENPVTL